MADKLFVLRDTLVSIVNDELVPFYYRKGALEGDRYTVDEAWYSYPDGKNHIKQRFKTHKDEIRLNDQKKQRMRLRHAQHDAPGTLIRCLRLQSRTENQIPYGRRW